MSSSRTGELSASMAVLCLVIQQPDTVSGVGVRMAKQFPDAGWSRNSAHGNLPSLAKQGLVRVTKQGPPDTRSLDRYEATSEGVAHVRRWIRESAAVPPVLRDSVQAKLEFSGREDLLGLIQTIREEEHACALRYAAAHACDIKAQQLRRRQRSRGRRPDLEEMLRDVKIADEAALWGLIVKRLKDLRENLEEVLEEFETMAASAG
jgi:DNA-binding PadR family transcriptional regulator